MAVLINKKRCDNSRECSCIVECPNKAFYWDEINKTIAVKENLCTKCRICMISCLAGAVKVSRDQEEYDKIKDEYDSDIMTVEKLFVDRYGAAIINEDYLLDVAKINDLISSANKSLLIELYNEDESNCLINSVPISEIIDVIKEEVTYRKVNIDDISMIKNIEIFNKIKKLPALCLIKKAEMLINYQGICDAKDKKQIIDVFSSNINTH